MRSIDFWSMMRRAALAGVLLHVASACERERVEVADTAAPVEGARPDGSDASEDTSEEVPFFPQDDASVAPRLCTEVGPSPGPSDTACAPCANGYAIVEGESTCDCCDGG